MKPTIIQKLKTKPKLEVSSGDSLIYQRLFCAATQGLLANNSFYDSDSIRWRNRLEPEELVEEAAMYADELFVKFKEWREIERFEGKSKP